MNYKFEIIKNDQQYIVIVKDKNDNIIVYQDIDYYNGGPILDEEIANKILEDLKASYNSVDTEESNVIINTEAELDIEKVRTLEDKLNDLYSFTEKFILSQYPLTKQLSDVADKEFFGAMLIAKTNKSSDTIYKEVYDLTAQILENKISFNELKDLLPQELLMPYIQLIKIALRVTYVQNIKKLYYVYKQKLINGEINDIDEVEYPKLPDYLL